MMSVFQIVIPGTTPYGFRLSGGDGDVVHVARVRSESKAEQAGLKENDVVVAINGILCFNLSYNSIFGLTELQEPLTIHLLRGEQAHLSWRQTCEGLTGDLLKLSEQEVISLLQKKTNSIFIQNDFFTKPEFHLLAPVSKVRTYSNPTLNTNPSQTSATFIIEPIKRSPSSTLTMTLVNPFNVEQRSKTFNAQSSLLSNGYPDFVNASPEMNKFKEVETNINSNGPRNTSTSEIKFESYRLNNSFDNDGNFSLFDDTLNKLEDKSVRQKSELQFVSKTCVPLFDKEDFRFLKAKTTLVEKCKDKDINSNLNSNLANTVRPKFQHNFTNVVPSLESNTNFYLTSPIHYNDNNNYVNEKYNNEHYYNVESKDYQTSSTEYQDQHLTSKPSFLVKPPNILKLYNIGNINKDLEQKVDDIKQLNQTSPLQFQHISPFKHDEQYKAANEKTSEDDDQVSLSYGPPPPPAPPIPTDGIPMNKSTAPVNAFSLLSTLDNMKDDKNNTLKNKVQMAKNIALSVLSPANKNSKGQKMFLKRKEMSSKWTVFNPEVKGNYENQQENANNFQQYRVNKPWLNNATTSSSSSFNSLEQTESSVPPITKNFKVPVSYKNFGEKPSNHVPGYRPISFPNYVNTATSLGYCDL